MANKGMTWDASADRQLLLSILKAQNVTVDYDTVAAHMSTGGQICTARAVQNRLQKLKTLAKESGTDGDEDGTPKPKATPRKRGAAAAGEESPTKKTKGSAKKGAKAKGAEVEDADDEETTNVKKEDEGDELD